MLSGSLDGSFIHVDEESVPEACPVKKIGCGHVLVLSHTYWVGPSDFCSLHCHGVGRVVIRRMR